MGSDRRFGISYALLVTTAIALSAWCAAEDRLPGDLWLGRRTQDVGGWFEPVAESIRALTTTRVVVIAGAILVTLAEFIRRRRAWLVLLAYLFAVPPVQATIKNLVDRPRPSPHELERRAGFASESFPSGHVLSGTAFFLLCAWLIAERVPAGAPRTVVWAVAVALCVLNGLANVYEGVHWPSDVLGGYLWALVLAGAAWWVVRERGGRSAEREL